MKTTQRPLRLFGFCAGLIITAISAHAAIVGPYVPDAKTLHLWHLNEAAAPALDAVSGGNDMTGLLNGATLGNASFSGFGNALNTADAGQDGIAAGERDAVLATSSTSPLSNVGINYADPTTGAFTYEAIVRIDFDPTKNFAAAPAGNGRNSPFVILSADGTPNATRLFQFRIMPLGTISGVTVPVLTFENVRVGAAQSTIYAAIPTGAEPNAIAQGSWYHVAVTYNGLPGTADNIKLYWTLLDAGRTTANLLTITSTTTMLSGLHPVSSTYAPLVIGNRAANGNFVGLIDEVRMSSVARDASEMMFVAAGNPVVVASPVDLSVAVGQTAKMSVTVSGEYPLAYQWRKGGVAVPGATQNVLTIDSASLSDAGSYDCQITHNAYATYSTAATLTVRTPRTLAWTGAADGNWDTATENWQDTSSGLAATYLPGDHVQFGTLGSGRPTVSLLSTLFPSSITVNAGFAYTFTGPGRIVGKTGLTKQGTGTLSMFNTNTYTGTTEIQGGVLLLRAGSIPGTGPIVNNSALMFQRAEGAALLNNMSGSGSITNWGVEVALLGNSTYNGPIVAQTNWLWLVGPNHTVNSSDIYVTWGKTGSGAASQSRFGVSGGATIPAGTTIHTTTIRPTPDGRTAIYSYSGNNTINGNIIMDGTGMNQLIVDNAGTTLTVNGNISGDLHQGDSSTQLSLRGVGGSGIMRGTINLACAVNKVDSSEWTIASTGNHWGGTVLGVGTLHLGAHNALPIDMQLQIGQGASLPAATFDLAGFNQQLFGFTDNPVSVPTIVTYVGNSSTTSDSTLTLTYGGSFSGVIQDTLASGTRKTALTLASGNFTLSAENTYSGPTTLAGGACLHLTGTGAIPNSSVIDVQLGSIDVASRGDQALTINAGQTLKGNGSFGIAGNLYLNGTTELKVSKSGTVTCDKISASSIIYGGTLKLVLSGDALNAYDSLELFSAPSGYSGTFTIEPAVPAFGYAWDTSTLASDGTLRIVPVLTIMTATVVGTDIVLAGMGGTPYDPFHIVASTDISAPLASWTSVKTGSFDPGGNFTVSIAVDSGTPKRFYRLVTP